MAKRHKLSKSSLHWFIKSRPFVLVPDIRRRFEMEPVEEACPIVAPKGRAFVALPQRAARLLEDLVKEHRVGLEMAADLNAPMVVGVFAFDLLKQPVGQVQMRPSTAAEFEPPDDEDAGDGDESAPDQPSPVVAGGAPAPPGPREGFGPRPPLRRPNGPPPRPNNGPGAGQGGPPRRFDGGRGRPPPRPDRRGDGRPNRAEG